jgi:hypothetical protein
MANPTPSSRNRGPTDAVKIVLTRAAEKSLAEMDRATLAVDRRIRLFSGPRDVAIHAHGQIVPVSSAMRRRMMSPRCCDVCGAVRKR